MALAVWVTYLAPSETWDGLFYHEPIVGFAIQNHGFAPVDLPQHQAVQATNGYARLGECVSMWFVIFTDKTLIELPNTIAAPALALALYAIARRAADRLAAMAWAPVIILMPGLWTQLRTTYVDVEVAFYIVAAVHFATRPVFRVRDAVCAFVAMALFTGTKLSAVVWVPPMAAVVTARLLWHHGRARPLSAALAILGGAAASGGVAAVNLLHNYRAFQNPLYPMSYENASLGVHWKGLNTLAELGPHLSLADLFATKYGAPIGGMADVHDRDYGYAVTWIVVPFAVIGGLRVLRAAASEIRDRTWGLSCNLLGVLLVGVFSVVVTPTIFPSRYNIHIVALTMVAASAGIAGARWHRVREGVLVSAIALSIVPLYWTRGWYFGVTMARIGELMRYSARDREFMNSEDFDVPERVARRREEELGPGDRVAFSEEIICPGALWNFRFSNELQMIAFDDPAKYFAKLAKYDPKWVVVNDKGAARAALDQRPNEWEYVGPGTKIDDGAVFRRKTQARRQ